MDIETLRALFPDFLDTDSTLIEGALLRAGAFMGGPDYTEWGPPGTLAAPTRVDNAQGWLAAYYLITSPFGAGTRAQPNDGKSSIYWQEFEKLRDIAATGFAVAGGLRSATCPSRGGFGPF